MNKVERFKSFVYTTTQVMLVGRVEALVNDIVPRRNSQPTYLPGMQQAQENV